MIDFFTKLTGWLWTYPVLIMLVGGGIVMTFVLGFFQFRYFPFILKQTFGKMFTKGSGDGTVSPFQAATSALASTIGASNIVGVPLAIAAGGPGAIFWMWLIAMFGCALKYSEIILGIKYRVKNEDGDYVGGPMYYLRDGAKLPLLGTLFAFFLMIEIGPSVGLQAASVVQSASTINVPAWISGVILVIIVGIVIYGGIKRIGQVTEKMVPFMAVTYFILSLIVIGFNYTEIPNAFALIFEGAFKPMAAVGGFTGSVIAATIKAGAARGAYSNEAGMGTSTIAHSAAVTDHPARQGLWGIFEIIVSTMFICTISGLLVLTTGQWTEVASSQAATMPSLAFQSVFGNAIGGGFLTVCMLLFVLSTIIVIIFYGEKQAEYLFGTKFSKVMRFVYLAFVSMGAVWDLNILVTVLDFTLAGVIIVNIIGVLKLAPEVRATSKDFFGNKELMNK